MIRNLSDKLAYIFLVILRRYRTFVPMSEK